MRARFALALMLAACTAQTEDAPDPTAEAPAAATPAGEEAEIRLAGVGLATPESVLHDQEADVYLVSNINGNPLDEDDNGFISRVSPGGEVLELRWIDGAGDAVTLNAPKGMAISGDSLFVADVGCVRIFHRTEGVALGEVCIPGADFLNDMATDPRGAVHVTDTGMRAGAAGFEPSGSDAVWRLDAGGAATAVARGTELGGPNGIAFGPQGAVVVTFASGEVYRLQPDGTRESVVPGVASRQLDGVVFTPEGGLLVSSWGESAVLRVAPDGALSPAVENVEAPADIGFDATRSRVLIPLFMANEVLIREIVPAVGAQ